MGNQTSISIEYIVRHTRRHLGLFDSDNATGSLANQTFRIQGQSYTLQRRLGGGGFGSVWSAISPNGRSAAIKAIDLSGRIGYSEFGPMELIESFQKEIKMAYKMRQETRHVVTIYGFDFDQRMGLALIAMELGGDTLSKRIEVLHVMKDAARRHRHSNDRTMARSGDYISPRERKNIWIQLNNIIQTLHRHRVVHRDLKPENLVFFGPIMKIVDLGIAQKEVIGYDPNANPIGSPHYSAPECFQRNARITSKADVWSAGAILYHMTYGSAPLDDSPHPPRHSNRTLSIHVDEILKHCLQQDPRQRASHNWLAQHPYTRHPMAL